MPSLTTLFSTLLLGSMLFFVAVVTPAVLQGMKEDHAMKYMRELFPRYYLWGAVLAAIDLLVALLSRSTLAIPMVVMLVGFIYGRQLLIPKMLAAKDRWLSSDSAGDKAAFKSLHKQSVILNSALILILIAIVIASRMVDPTV